MSPPTPPARLRAVALTVVALALGGAAAQKVQVDGGVPAVFAPTSAEILASVACSVPDCLEPLAPATTLKLIRQRRSNSPVLRGSRSAWSPSGDLELWARYTVDGNQSAPYVTSWFELGASQQGLFGTTDPNTSITVEYQLRFASGAPSGSYQTTVSYDGGPGSRGVSHLVSVELAPAIGLRINGEASGPEVTLVFDYAPSPLLYLDAVTTGNPLMATGGDLVDIEVFTNSPGGYRVTVAVDQVANIDGNLFPPEALLLAGVPAPSSVFDSTAPTEGYERLLEASDYRLAVDGDESPGSYSLTLTFTAEMLP